MMSDEETEKFIESLTDDLKKMGVTHLLDHELVSGYMKLIMASFMDQTAVNNMLKEVGLRFVLRNKRIPGKGDTRDWTAHELIRFALWGSLKFLEKQSELQPELRSQG